ncbi:hypothetical protein TNCT_633551 [Trichonephila clavata]|uniref:Uncharacterized protein n=1 Tax=Trichonephila clavata TaxID=2740835 RepID=A0A8X6HD15_TRICU|nr:hypothetical protein TNCT_633551 [Trichonephila clavata]
MRLVSVHAKCWAGLASVRSSSTLLGSFRKGPNVLRLFRQISNDTGWCIAYVLQPPAHVFEMPNSNAQFYSIIYMLVATFLPKSTLLILPLYCEKISWRSMSSDFADRSPFTTMVTAP